MIQEKINGKTYSLYSNQDASDYFYKGLREVTDSILQKVNSQSDLLDYLRKNSRNKRTLKKEIRIKPGKSLLGSILRITEDSLSKYFTDMDTHLKNLSLAEKCDSTLTTSREQYLLFMLEIELVNRFNRDKFKSSEAKYAFLPHCLHDLDKDCLSASDGTDYVCKSCSKNCSINSISKLMKLRNIKAYIWREADLKKTFKLARSSGQSIGVFGVAC
ncbi:MAG: DUF116 domain-containing protein, partial [Ignavibacteria bacterium]|nr:DUF116 domain-containing protein [Ignavibacteria bacterium]